MRHPAGSREGSAPPTAVGRLPTTTQPPWRMPSAVVSPTPPGQDRPAGSLARLANSCIEPVGDTCTSVVPVPWTLALLLKLLTRVSPAVSLPAVVGTPATPWGFTSPLAGTVEATCVEVRSWLRNDVGACGSAAGLALEALEVDEQAVAARPRMAIRTVARCQDFTMPHSLNVAPVTIRILITPGERADGRRGSPRVQKFAGS